MNLNNCIISNAKKDEIFTFLEEQDCPHLRKVQCPNLPGSFAFFGNLRSLKLSSSFRTIRILSFAGAFLWPLIAFSGTPRNDLCKAISFENEILNLDSQ